MYDYKKALKRDVLEYLRDERIDIQNLSHDERTNLEEIIGESYVVGCYSGYFDDDITAYHEAIYSNFNLLYEALYLECRNLEVKYFFPSLDQLKEWDHLIRWHMLSDVMDEMYARK